MIVSKGNLSKIIDKNGKVTAVAFKQNRTYKMTSKLKRTGRSINVINSKNNESERKVA
jgi:hypothetical protein